MAGRDDHPAGGHDLLGAQLDDLAVLVVERLVHLVEEQDRRPGLLGDCEAEPRAHPLRVARDGPLEVVAQAARLLHLLDRGAGLGAGEACEDGEVQRVLAPGQEPEEPRLDREERGDPAGDVELTGVRVVDAREEAEQRRLPRAAAAEQREALAARHREADVAEPPHLGAAAAEPRLGRRDDPALPVEEELDSDSGRRDHSTTFANWRCSLRYSGTNTARRTRPNSAG